MSKSQYIGVDFDGTIVEYAYPEIGKANEGCLEVLNDLIAKGHKIILYTMRAGDRLAQAVDYLEENGIQLYGVNENKSQKHWTDSPKIYANIYIDDAALGVPLVTPEKGKPYVDWYEVRELLDERGIL